MVEASSRSPHPPSVAEAGEAFLAGLGPTLVVAPHPDDESIGCGGLVAMLCLREVPVSVVLVSDGTMSHPNSARFPPAARHALRLGEMREALACLGAAATIPIELGCRDGDVPCTGHSGFAAAASALADALNTTAARTLVAPWRRDPHPDHRASSELARAARDMVERPLRFIEYAVWLEDRGGDDEQPQPDELREWRLDISSVVDRKLAAVAAHRSQCGQVIDDDPGGFVLSPAMRRRCAEPVERYFEVGLW